MNDPQYTPIVNSWIRQYSSGERCKSLLHQDTKQVELIIYNYGGGDIPSQLGRGHIVIDVAMSERIWTEKLADQTRGKLKSRSSAKLCIYCASFLTDIYLGASGEARKMLQIPFYEENKNVPGIRTLSWVLFNRMSDPDTNLMMVSTQSTIEQVVQELSQRLRQPIADFSDLNIDRPQ